MTAGLQSGAAYSLYRLDLSGFRQDVAEIKAAYSQLGASGGLPLPAPRLPLPAAPGSSRGSGGDPAVQLQREQNAAISLAQARARLALVEGDEARALGILRNAQTQNTAASERALLGVQTQVARLESGRTAAQQFGDAMKGSLLGIVGPAALAGVAIGALLKTGELIKLGAQAEQTRVRFDQLAKQAGTTGEAMLAALREASSGTISDTSLQLDAMKASLLGVAQNAEQLGPLLAIARDRAQQMGISTEFAFDSLVTGLGRGSRLILDNIGVIVKESAVNEAYAKSVGKTVSALTDQEKKQALINEVLRQGRETIEKTGGAAETTATKIERATTAWENFKTGVGTALALTIFDTGKQAFEGQAVAALVAARNMTEYRVALQKVNTELGRATQGRQQIDGLTAAQFAYAKSLIESGVAAGTATERARALSNAAADQAVSMSLSTSAINLQSPAMITAGQAGIYQSGAMILAAQSNIQAADAALAATQATNAHYAVLQESAQASVADTAAKNEQAAVTQLLTLQTNAAADAFMQLHPNISASGVAAMAAAGQINPLLAQLLQARIRADEARIALIAFNNIANIGAVNAKVNLDRSSGRTGRGDSSDMRDELAGAKAYNDALRDRTTQTGSAAAKQKLYNDELQAAILYHGKDSVEAIRAQTQLDAFEEQSIKKGGAGRKGAGAAKLSDQQKFNNAQLVNEQKADDQLEDLELKHQKNQLKIQTDYERKSLAQQQANEISKRRSRFDFYSGIQDLDAKSQQQLSAEYEQAFAESQAIAQRGDKKLASEYLKLKQDQISADKDYYAKRNEIEKGDGSKGDKAAALRRLDDLRAIRKDAEQEELKQLQEGGDSLKSERDQQLQDEAASYAESSGKIETANDRKDQSALLSAQLAGKAISGERVEVQGLTGDYQRLGQAAQRGRLPLPSGAATGNSAGDTTPQQRAQQGIELMQVLDASVVSAIAAQSAMQAAKFDMLGGKLDLVAERVSDVERAVRSSATRSAVG